jgi:8-oxo-dGTP pyrophosphatase MutT (NUDIX family)
MHNEIHFHYLKKQLGLRLPGTESHLKMLPPGRILKLPAEQENYYDSAVLLLLFPFQSKVQICLIRRPATMKNHAGQIAFPGGKREKVDTDYVQTALREAHEEIGVDRNSIQIVGQLSTVFVEVSSFLITPIVGWLDEKPDIVIDPSEVDEVILVSLEELSDQKNRCSRELETRTGRLCVPGYEINGSFIWGATAMILSELIDVHLGNQL